MASSNHTPEIAQEQDTEALLREFLQQSDSELEPITPDRAVELYLEDKARECQAATVRSHRSRLGFFVEWCDDRGIENLNELTAREVHEFRVWRRQDLNVVSEKTQMDTLRVFVEWCESIDAVQQGLFKKIKSPDIPDGENAREKSLDEDRADAILEYLETYEYASVEHVTWLILVETGVRMGGAHSLDIADYHPGGETPHLQLVHRPETDTSLKNGERANDQLALLKLTVALSMITSRTVDPMSQTRTVVNHFWPPRRVEFRSLRFGSTSTNGLVPV